MTFFHNFQRNKAPNENAIPLLLPQHHMVIPHYMGNSEEIEFGDKNNHVTHNDFKRNSSFSNPSSFQDVPLLMPQEADGPDAGKIEPKLHGLNALDDLLDQPSRPSRIPFSFRKSKIEPLIPYMPMRDFVDDHNTFDPHNSHVMHSGPEVSEKDWWEVKEQGDQVLSADETGQVGPRVSTHCQVFPLSL